MYFFSAQKQELSDQRYSRSSHKRPPWELREVVATRPGRSREWGSRKRPCATGWTFTRALLLITYEVNEPLVLMLQMFDQEVNGFQSVTGP